MTIASNQVNAVALCVLPDSPCDPFTGLQVPTIAVATAGGVSVIQNNGTVVNSGAGSFNGIAMTPYAIHARDGGGGSSWFYTTTPINQLAPGFSLSTMGTSSFTPLGTTNNVVATDSRSNLFKLDYNSPTFRRRLLNAATPAASLDAVITNTYNTGWMVGDIRRCWLSSNVAESITATELVTNGTFNADLNGWTQQATSGGGIAWSAGAMAVTGGTSSLGGGYQDLPLVPGKTYRISGDPSADSLLIVYPSTGFASGTLATLPGGGTGAGTVSLTFVAVAATQRIMGYSNSNKSGTIDNVSVQEVIADRSYKNQPLTINGTLAKTAVASAAQLMFYSGWSATNYAQQAYSADLDFGTGAWSVGAWVSVPATLPVASFPLGPELLTNGGFADATGWSSLVAGASISGGQLNFDGTTSITSAANIAVGTATAAVVAHTYAVTWTIGADTTLPVAVAYGGQNGTAHNAPGTYTDYFTASSAGSFTLVARNTTGARTGWIDNISVKEVGIACIFDRSAASGAYIRAGVLVNGNLSVEAYDGTTTRRATSPAAYNTATAANVRVEYATSGTLTLKVNGQPVATATGTPLLTLNNASAVTTVGNARTLDAAFPGSIALVKVGATTPTQEQSTFMYEQEKFLFMPGAQCTLPDSGAVVDMAYDSLQDKLKVVSAANESAWTGLVSTSSSPVAAGSFTKTAHWAGVKLLARSATNPGVDVSLPPVTEREELYNRAERAAALAHLEEAFDYTAGFTATTAAGSTALTSVAALSVPSTVNLRGVPITGAGIPANTYITDISGTTIYMSAAATASASAVQISMTTLPLPVGYEVKEVISAGASKQEGATKDWTRSYDGFKESEVFAVAPGYSAWVQLKARRMRT